MNFLGDRRDHQENVMGDRIENVLVSGVSVGCSIVLNVQLVLYSQFFLYVCRAVFESNSVYLCLYADVCGDCLNLGEGRGILGKRYLCFRKQGQKHLRILFLVGYRIFALTVVLRIILKSKFYGFKFATIDSR